MNSEEEFSSLLDNLVNEGYVAFGSPDLVNDFVIHQLGEEYRENPLIRKAVVNGYGKSQTQLPNERSRVAINFLEGVRNSLLIYI